MEGEKVRVTGAELKGLLDAMGPLVAHLKKLGAVQKEQYTLQQQNNAHLKVILTMVNELKDSQSLMKQAITKLDTEIHGNELEDSAMDIISDIQTETDSFSEYVIKHQRDFDLLVTIVREMNDTQFVSLTEESLLILLPVLREELSNYRVRIPNEAIVFLVNALQSFESLFKNSSLAEFIDDVDNLLHETLRVVDDAETQTLILETIEHIKPIVNY